MFVLTLFCFAAVALADPILIRSFEITNVSDSSDPWPTQETEVPSFNEPEQVTDITPDNSTGGVIPLSSASQEVQEAFNGAKFSITQQLLEKSSSGSNFRISEVLNAFTQKVAEGEWEHIYLTFNVREENKGKGTVVINQCSVDIAIIPLNGNTVGNYQLNKETMSCVPVQNRNI